MKEKKLVQMDLEVIDQHETKKTLLLIICRHQIKQIHSVNMNLKTLN
jgi:hypothetical protein